MPKFRPLEKYTLSLNKNSDGVHNLRAESSDGSHNVELLLTKDEAYQLLSKGRVEVDARVNGVISEV